MIGVESQNSQAPFKNYVIPLWKNILKLLSFLTGLPNDDSIEIFLHIWLGSIFIFTLWPPTITKNTMEMKAKKFACFVLKRIENSQRKEKFNLEYCKILFEDIFRTQGIFFNFSSKNRLFDIMKTPLVELSKQQQTADHSAFPLP